MYLSLIDFFQAWPIKDKLQRRIKNCLAWSLIDFDDSCLRKHFFCGAYILELRAKTWAEAHAWVSSVRQHLVAR